MSFLSRTDNRIDAILSKFVDQQGRELPELDKWHTSSAAPLVITYQFETAQPGDMGWQFSGWSAWTAAKEAAIRSVLDEYETIINVKFVRNDTLADPDINFGLVNMFAGDGMGSWNWSTRTENSQTVKNMDHFVVFQNTVDLTAPSARSLILHEVGHAMNLEHPGPYDVGGNLPPAPHLPESFDNNRWTVMSYTENPDNGQDSDHLMLYDIAALQARWGANLSSRTGNDVYSGPNGLVQTIWDGGGNDRIDGTGKAAAVTIDLREGAFSSMGALNNLSIAFGTVIENAIGSAFGDTITGNEIANVLTGAGGDDAIDGGLGIDTAVFGGARSQYKVTQLSATSVRIEDLRSGSPDGTDTISNVEQFQFSDGTLGFAGLLNAPVAGSVAIGDVTVAEGNAGTQVATFTVTRSGGTAAFNVNFGTSNGSATAGEDYVAISNGLLQFAAGETSKTISVVINGDTKVETSETFNVQLLNPTNGATLSRAQAAGTITNDDVAPVAGSVAIQDISVAEGNAGTKVATFTVTRSGGTAAFNVNFGTSNGSATAGEDYVAISNGLLQFAAGETSKTISVTINGDTKVETSETFNVLLLNPTNGATLSRGQAAGTITNDDVAPVAGSVVIGDATITEGHAGTQVMTFTVTRSGGTAAFNVDFATKAGTASAADGDYVGRSNTLTFAAGEMQKTISVTINSDTKTEGTETFDMVLSNATNGAIIADATGTGTITNDDVTRVTEDFNGDGKSDILFHNNGGAVAMWLQDGFTRLANLGAGTQAASWHVEGTEDFGGDGKSDILWHNDNGQVQLWHMNGATASQVQNLGSRSTDWHIGGVDDFNGDDKADVLWFSDSNQVQLWTVNNGAVMTHTVGTIGAGWSIKDTADFTGDGKADVLLQKGTSIAMWEMDGATLVKATTFATMGDSFHFAGAEDFNGDGKSDILWHNDSNGQVVLWQLDGTNVIGNTTAGWTAAGWDIADLGDFNNDGHADILLRNGSTGALAEWQMDGDRVLQTQGIGSASTDWHVV